MSNKNMSRGKESSSEEKRGAPLSTWELSVALFLFTFMAIVVFFDVFAPDSVLFTTDNSIGNEALVKSSLPGAFKSFWRDGPILGSGGVIWMTWSRLLLWLLPLRFFVNWIRAIDLVLASLFLYMFLRLRGIGRVGGIMAALAAYWLGTNLTLTYAGHLGKFGVLMFSAAALYLFEKAARRGSLVWAVLAGGAVGAMFLEQQDSAVFFGIFLAGYALLAVVREQGWKVRMMAQTLIPMGAMVFLIAGLPALGVYRANVQDVDVMSEQTDPQERYDFCTQWSQPPDESIDFIAPGYMGWRSGEVTGAYWGRTGQDAKWETTKTGFRNFKLETVYIGVIPCLLAMFALFLALFLRKGLSADRRRDILFWGGATILALCLSFGRHFFLYKLFFQLPLVSSIRNPNKFVQVFQVALAILSGIGLDLVVKRVWEKGKDGNSRIAWGFVVVCGLSTVFLFLGAGWLAMSRDYMVGKFAAENWGGYSSAIVANMIRALVHAGILGIVLTGSMFALVQRRFVVGRWVSACVSVVLLLAVAVDAKIISEHYISTMTVEANVGENHVTRAIGANIGDGRVYMVTQQSFYNRWLTFLFPYRGIPTFNFSAMPRWREDEKHFLTAMSQRPDKLWQLASVTCVLTPIEAWSQLQGIPSLKQSLKPVLGFNVFQKGDGIGVAAATTQRPARHVLAVYDRALPRLSLYDEWVFVEDAETCSRLLSDGFDASRQVVVSASHKDSFQNVQPETGDWEKQIEEVSDDRRTKLTFTTKSNKPCVLLAVQKFDGGWKAVVDGKPVPMIRCNYVCQGVFLPKGEHKISLEYSQGSAHLWAEIAGICVCGLAGCWLLSRSIKESSRKKHLALDSEAKSCN